MKLSGFTLLETLVVLAIIGLTSTFTLAFNLTSMVRSEVTQERDSFIALVAMRTRSFALTNYDNADHGIFIDSENRSYVLFSGTHYVVGDYNNLSIPFTSDITDVTSSGGNTIVFERLSGNVITGTTTISFTSNDSKQTVDINDVGRINW